MIHRVCYRRFGLVTEDSFYLQDEELADSNGFSFLCKHLNQRILSLKMVFSNEYEMSATNSVLNVQNEARSLLEYIWQCNNNYCCIMTSVKALTI